MECLQIYKCLILKMFLFCNSFNVFVKRKYKKTMIKKSEELNFETSKTQEMLVEITDFQEKINRIQYSAKDLMIEPRFVNQWKGKGLLFKEIEKDQQTTTHF